MLGRSQQRASVQETLLDLAEVREDVLVLKGGDTRALLEVTGINLPLKSEAEQEVILEGQRALLNGLDGPVQLVSHARPQDIGAYLADLAADHAGRAESEALTRLRLDHTAFVHDLAARRSLLQHWSFLVVAGPSLESRRAATPLPRILPFGRSPASQVAEVGSFEAAQRQLAARSEEVREALQGMGLTARRLGVDDLGRTVHAFLAPQQAARQRLGAGAMTPALVVRSPGSRPLKRRGTVAEASGGGSSGMAADRAVARFERGHLSGVDLLAPAAVEVHSGHLRVEDAYTRTLAVVGYPRYVRLGWLRPLLELDEPLDLAIHLFPLESAAVIGSLTRKLVQLQSSRLRDARSGKIADAEREVAHADVEKLREQLQRCEERVFAVGLYITLRAETAAGLEALTRRVESTLASLMAHSRRCILQQPAGFRSTVPWGRDHVLATRNLDTTSAATLFPFGMATVSTERGVLLGVAKGGGAPIILDPFSPQLENASMAVFATSGAGKSYAVKLLALRSLLLGHEALVVDPEGEYGALCREVGGQEVRLGAASPHVLNPFDLATDAPAHSEEGDERVDPLAEKVVALLGLLGILLAESGQPLGRAELGALDRAIHATYGRKGITPDPATHGREAPVLADLHSVLREQGEDYGLADRLERYVSGSLRRLFAGQTNVDLDRPLVAFSLRDMDDALRPLATYLVADFVWTRARRGAPRPRRFIVDEAWSIVRHHEGADLLLGLAKRGRKHWLGLVTVTQDVEDCLGSPQGRAVVANAATTLLMKQSPSSIEAVSTAFKLTEGERRELLAARRGEGLLSALGTRVSIHIEASAREHALITTNPAELAARAAQVGREVFR